MPETRRRRPTTTTSEQPARRRRRVAEAEPEEEPTPRRRRPRAVEEREERAETTRRNRSSGRSRPTRSYDDEDEEPRRGRKDKIDRPAMPKGFGAADELRKKSGSGRDFPTEFSITGDRQIIKFLDPEPFVTYNQHWLRKEGKKSYVCPETVGEECPLCDLLDDSTRTFTAFNVIVVPPFDPDPGWPKDDKTYDGEEPALQVLTAASRLTTAIQNEAARGDLTLGYFALSKSGKNQQTSYQLLPVKERDLEEDFGVAPLEDDEVAEFEDEMYDDESFPYRSSHSDLDEVANEMLG